MGRWWGDGGGSGRLPAAGGDLWMAASGAAACLSSYLVRDWEAPQAELPGEDSAVGWGPLRTPLWFSFGFWGSCYLGQTLRVLKPDNGAWMALTVSGGRGWGRGRADSRTRGSSARAATAVFIDLCWGNTQPWVWRESLK